jgi:phosphoadenosine phosphosulfate reductase
MQTLPLALSASALSLSEAMTGMNLADRLEAACASLPGRTVFTTSFGLEDQALAHVIFSRHLPVTVVTLDTGRLFEETYDVWAATEERYGTRIEAFSPDADALAALIGGHGVNGFRRSIAARIACCHTRKVGPLGRALAGATTWITGLRASQSHDRGQTPLAAFDPERGLVKVNPLADWSRERVIAFLSGNDVPCNKLHDRGFASIGCAPCTRAIAPGEPERAGRWWWEDEAKKECGLHRRPAAALAATPAAQEATNA